MKGRKVVANWGGLYPQSYGVIRDVDGNLATIEWAQHDYCELSVESIDRMKEGNIDGIGIFLV